MRVPSEQMEVEVLIIGAGPAGLIAAYELGKQSIDTVVLEEHPEIGVPTCCAGLISVSGLSRLGIRPPAPVILNRDNDNCVPNTELLNLVNLELQQNGRNSTSHQELDESSEILEKMQCIERSKRDSSKWWLRDRVRFTYR